MSREVETTAVEIAAFLRQVYGIQEPVERARILTELDVPSMALLEERLAPEFSYPSLRAERSNPVTVTHVYAATQAAKVGG